MVRKWRPTARYRAAHARVAKAYGPASNHRCQHCGDQAEDWAYDYQDPEEKQDPRCGPYSLDPFHYMPLCRECHKRFDNKRRQGEGWRPTHGDRVRCLCGWKGYRRPEVHSLPCPRCGSRVELTDA